MQHHTLETIYTLLSASNTPKQNIAVEIKKLLPLIAQVDPENYSKNYRELMLLIQQIEQEMQQKQLTEKTIVGVGGGFGAGKSRFINSLLGIEVLPEALEPCTAVATYLSASTLEQTHALNLLNHHIRLKPEQLGQLRHFVGDTNTQNDIQLGELIQYVHLGIPQLTWEHIAFLDTPGYSKADAEHHHHSDEQLAINQLSKADYILWLVNAKNGTIRDEDLQFLQKIQPKQPIFVVLTQSDLVNRSDIEPILQSVRQNLKNRNIAIAGIMAWAAPIMKLQGQRLAGDGIGDWLDKINQPIQHHTIKDLDILIQHVFNKGIHHVNQLQQEIETLIKVKDKQDLQNITQVTNIIEFKQKNKTSILQSSRNLMLDMAKIAEYLFKDIHQAAQYHALIIREFDKNYSDSNSLEWLYQQSCIGIKSVQKEFKNITDYLKNNFIQYKYALSLKDNQEAIYYMYLSAKQNYQPAFDWLFDKTHQENIDALFKLTELFKIGKIKNQDKNKIFKFCYQYIRTNNSDQRIENFVKYQATNQNNTEVQYNYALILEEINDSVSMLEYMFLAAKQRYQPAYDWFFNQANKKNINALFSLTELFKISKINQQDKSKLFKICYQYIINNNHDKRIEDFIKYQAIKQNDAEVQYNYALIFEENKNITSTIEYMFLAAKQSYHLAYDWLFTQATQGNIDVQFKLTELFELGKTNKKDEKTIFNYCYDAIRYQNDHRFFKFVEQQAIDKKVAEAQYLLATCYAFGYGTNIDYKKAYQFYKNNSIGNSVYNRTVLDYLGLSKKSKNNKLASIVVFKKYSNDPKFSTTFSWIKEPIIFKKPSVLDYNEDIEKLKINYTPIYLILIIITFLILTTNIIWIAGIIALGIIFYITLSRVKLNNIEFEEIRINTEEEAYKGVWTDSKTGLMWARISIGQKWINGECIGDAEKLNWNNAKTACQNFRLADYEDWRLPMIDELETLIKEQSGNYNCPEGMLFRPIKTNLGRYWSSSFFGCNEWVRSVPFGGPLSNYHGKDNLYYVRAVRGEVIAHTSIRTQISTSRIDNKYSLKKLKISLTNLVKYYIKKLETVCFFTLGFFLAPTIIILVCSIIYYSLIFINDFSALFLIPIFTSIWLGFQIFENLIKTNNSMQNGFKLFKIFGPMSAVIIFLFFIYKLLS
ncbi:dynamin family protein [Acinetobacter junii]|uniref:Dynamin family protein n=1 Tax=Acinetobacter junii TaxID=40215 RepID=A0AAX1MJ23_ACIJU|nr:dynamin family protein [Acinetobacter junii]QUY37628.1 dynamin family protein [Acinetobacter junii]